MRMAGSLHPPFSLFGCAEKRKRAVHGPKEKKTWGENLPMLANFAQSTGAGLNRCQCELPVFCRLRLTPFRPEPLCRSCNCPRGCFASLTQGPQRLFPRFAPSWYRAGVLSGPFSASSGTFGRPHAGPGALAGTLPHSLRYFRLILRGGNLGSGRSAAAVTVFSPKFNRFVAGL